MLDKRRLVLGTRNRKKGEELVQLFAPYAIDLRILSDFPDAIDVVEDGKTFRDNAARKAVQSARHLGQWVLGEDSGLAVDALQGAPGVMSARYSGPQATDESNMRRLLEELGNLPIDRRTASYVCHATLADPTGQVRAETESRCRGRIRLEPAGTSGFGYDPLFEVVEYHRTFAQLGACVKSVLSHRARAIRRLLPQMVDLAHAGIWPPTSCP